MHKNVEELMENTREHLKNIRKRLDSGRKPAKENGEVNLIESAVLFLLYQDYGRIFPKEMIPHRKRA